MNLLNTAPTEIKHTLLEELTAWSFKYPNSTNEEAFQHRIEPMSYSLKMLWLGRYDKLSPKSLKAYEWISENYLAENFKEQFMNKKEKSFSEDPLLISIDIIKRLWNDYLTLDNTDNLIVKPIEKIEKKSFFKKIFK